MGFFSDLLGGGNDTQTTSSSPWSGLQPYLTGSGGQPGLFNEASRLYQQGPQSYYPGQTYAGFDPLQQQSQQMGIDYANGLSGFANQMQGANSSLLNGAYGTNATTQGYMDMSNPSLQNYMNPNNQYVQDSINAAVGDMGNGVRDQLNFDMSNIGDAATGSGQFGSSRHAISDSLAKGRAIESINRNTANISSSMRQNAYNQGQNTFNNAYGIGANMYDSSQGRGLNAMTSGLGLGGQTMQAGMAPSNLLNTIGGERQGMVQNAITDQFNAYNFNQQSPWQNLSMYQNALSGNYMGSGGTSTVPVTGGSPLTGAMGGALAGAQLGSIVPGLGTGIGAGIGGVLGLLGNR